MRARAARPISPHSSLDPRPPPPACRLSKDLSVICLSLPYHSGAMAALSLILLRPAPGVAQPAPTAPTGPRPGRARGMEGGAEQQSYGFGKYRPAARREASGDVDIDGHRPLPPTVSQDVGGGGGASNPSVTRPC